MAPEPVERARRVDRRLSRGRTPDTPMLALSMAALGVGAMVVVVLAISLVLYYVI